MPSEPKNAIKAFVDHYYRRCDEKRPRLCLGAHNGKHLELATRRKEFKRRTLQRRTLQQRKEYNSAAFGEIPRVSGIL